MVIVIYVGKKLGLIDYSLDQQPHYVLTVKHLMKLEKNKLQNKKAQLS